MFSGIIQLVGKINSIKPTSGGSLFSFTTNLDFLKNSKIGDSIASNGVCLTIVKIDADKFYADLSKETLKLTTFATAKIGDIVNFEKSLTLNQGIDGHLVSGHIDGLATIIAKNNSGDNLIFKIQSPVNLSKYIAKKGSITLNGISLTVNFVEGDIFTVNIIPHTLCATNLNTLNQNGKLNIEVDIIARHLERLLENE